MEFAEALGRRKMVRNYTDEPVEREAIERGRRRDVEEALADVGAREARLARPLQRGGQRHEQAERGAGGERAPRHLDERHAAGGRRVGGGDAHLKSLRPKTSIAATSNAAM